VPPLGSPRELFKSVDQMGRPTNPLPTPHGVGRSLPLRRGRSPYGDFREGYPEVSWGLPMSMKKLGSRIPQSIGGELLTRPLHDSVHFADNSSQKRHYSTASSSPRDNQRKEATLKEMAAPPTSGFTRNTGEPLLSDSGLVLPLGSARGVSRSSVGENQPLYTATHGKTPIAISSQYPQISGGNIERATAVRCPGSRTFFIWLTAIGEGSATFQLLAEFLASNDAIERARERAESHARDILRDTHCVDECPPLTECAGPTLQLVRESFTTEITFCFTDKSVIGDLLDVPIMSYKCWAECHYTAEWRIECRCAMGLRPGPH